MTNNINEKELENVTGGWQYANGSFVNYGNYIVYTVAPGDVLSPVDLHLGEAYEFADDGLNALDAVGADAVRVHLLCHFGHGAENRCQGVLVGQSEFLQPHVVLVGNVVRVASYPVTQLLVVFVGESHDIER